MSLPHLMLILMTLLQNLDILDCRLYPCYANFTEAYLCKTRALNYFSWENLEKHPFTPDRATVIEQSHSPIHIQLGEQCLHWPFSQWDGRAPRMMTCLCLSTMSFHWITINYKLCQLCWLKFAKESVSFVGCPLASSLFYAYLNY